MDNIKAQITFDDEIIVDNFAGGGGASNGIEQATGRPVTIAINHDPDAILMHKTNHPYTEHYQESVWDIDPVEVCRGRKIGLAWFSPDCKHFSKAKGGKPVEKSIRGLAWIVLRWAGTVRPRVIMLENVEEFQTWGPVRKGKPVKSKSGETFKRWKSQLEALGYVVEHRELRACDYGAPTIRKRFFVIARCDGKPIVWPKPTHGPADSPEVKEGKLKPYRSAAECIDFSLPCPSIFNRKKPLAVNTQKRIARGLDKFVINEAKPFIVHIGNGERKGQQPRVQDIDKPLSTIVGSCKQYLGMPIMQTAHFDNTPNKVTDPLTTITTANCHSLVTAYITKFQQNSIGQRMSNPLDTVMVGATRFGLIAPSLIQYHSETAKGEVRGQRLDNPLLTVDGANRYGIQIPYLSKFYGGVVGADIKSPLPTVTAVDHNALTIPYMSPIGHTGFCDDRNYSIKKPLQTIVSKAEQAISIPYLSKYYGTGENLSDANDPLPTITAKDRMSLNMPFLTQYYKGSDHNADVRSPLNTITVQPRHFLCDSYLTVLRNNMDCRPLNEPLNTITSSGAHFALTKVYIRKYAKGSKLGYWPEVRKMLNEYTDWCIYDDEILIFNINGVEYFISDIGLRMLQPKELYLAQGFPADYIIERDYTGKAYVKSKQVARCGNAVPPAFSKALVQANLPEMCEGVNVNSMHELNEIIAVG